MTALNAYYNLSGLDDHDLMKYFYDGETKTDITTTGFDAENYTIIHDPSSPYNTMGIFIADFDAPHVQASITELNGTIHQDAWNTLAEGEINITFYVQDSEDEYEESSYENNYSFQDLPSNPTLPL